MVARGGPPVSRALVLVADNVVCRGMLVRELCTAMRVRAALAHESHHAMALVHRGEVAAMVTDFDAFGRQVLAEVALRDVALPVLLTSDGRAPRAAEVAAEIYRLGLTQVTVIPRPLTTERLRRFLVETGVLGERPRLRPVA
jgi:hypothetical protein